MRILRVHPFLKAEATYPFAGGMARTSLRLTKELARAGHEVLVFPFPELIGTSTRWDLQDQISVPVGPTMAWPGWRGLPHALRRARGLQPPPLGLRDEMSEAMGVQALDQAVLHFQPEIIHNHLPRRPFARLVGSLPRHVPLVLTHHHGEAGDALDIYDRIVFVSQSQREEIRAQAGLQADRLRVVHNPVADAFTHGATPGAAERNDLLFSGALRDRKGLDLLLEAYALEPRLNHHRLHLYGEGPQREAYEHQARELGLNVEFHGRVSVEVLVRALCAARLLVNPSRLEGWSASINEALCCGVPVVGWAPQVAELESQLDMRVGLAFDARTQSAHELATSLLTALEDASLAELTGERLGRAAREQFSAERFVNGYLGVYRELL
jgi:glycosyltransferase involved in cell wall biosynthesis